MLLFEFRPLYNDPTLLLMGIFGFETLSSALPSFYVVISSHHHGYFLIVKYVSMNRIG